MRDLLGLLQRLGLSGAPEVETAEDLPDRLGPYRLLERIGAGAMGIVYRARRVEFPGDQAKGATSADLALKILHPGLLPVRRTRVRFRRERSALRELHHPGICPLVDEGEIGGVLYLVMPFVVGESLRACFERAHCYPSLARGENRAARSC